MYISMYGQYVAGQKGFQSVQAIKFSEAIKTKKITESN